MDRCCVELHDGIVLEDKFCHPSSAQPCNRPLPSFKNPHFQNEARCTTFKAKMSYLHFSVSCK